MFSFNDHLLTLKGIMYAGTTLCKTQYMSTDEIIEFQINELRKTLIYAYQRIPFYQNLFWKCDFDPYLFVSLDSLSKLPILSKETVLANPADFYSSNEMSKSIRLRTSGTTGNPLVAYASKRQWIVEQAAVWRQWSWAGYKFRDKMAIIRSHAPQHNEPLTKFNRLKNWLYMSPYHLDEETVLKYLQILKKWKPIVLRGYPSSLYIMARTAHLHKIKIPSLKFGLTASEVLSEEYRAEIESVFNIKVFDHYGQAEITTMLHECERHSGMHILEDYAYTELLPTTKKNEYKLIASNLFNESMPLIRYDTGDLVIPSTEKCTCGRNFRLIQKIIGRSDQLLIHSDGYFLPSINFYTYFAKKDEIFRYQIIQNSISEVKVLIQFRESKNKQIIHEEISEEMNTRFGGSVELIESTDFTVSGEGKFNTVVQNIKF
jgi:phenylacetate-CoA ligase